MTEQDIEALKAALSRFWPPASSEKAQRYIGKFYERKRVGTKIAALVQGNHGIYTVSIRVEEQTTLSACSCYKGKHGYCHADQITVHACREARNACRGTRGADQVIFRAWRLTLQPR